MTSPVLIQLHEISGELTQLFQSEPLNWERLLLELPPLLAKRAQILNRLNQGDIDLQDEDIKLELGSLLSQTESILSTLNDERSRVLREILSLNEQNTAKQAYLKVSKL